jgi:formylglycine-generating enzyme required for sulfatase activity
LTDEFRTGAGNLRDLVEAAAETTEKRTGRLQVPYVSYNGAVSAIRQIVFRTTASTAPAMPLPSVPRAEPVVADDYALVAGKTAGERKLIEVAPGVSVPFRWCPAGAFTMGSPATEHAVLKAAGKAESFYSDEVQHRVILTKGFWLAETEVTQGQWQAVLKTTLVQQADKMLDDDTVYASLGNTTLRDIKASKKGEGSKHIGVESENIAMQYINYSEAEVWCTKATGHAGLRGWTVTLPTEAQWEYACRAGTSGMTPAGDFTTKGELNAPGLDAIAWYGGNSTQAYSGADRYTMSWTEKMYIGGRVSPRRVGTKQPNEWGLCDMIGNVFEWCADWHGPYAGDGTDPIGAGRGVNRVYRGGSWVSGATNCRAACRLRGEPGIRLSNLGFRPALVPSK